jgi:predicted methyltransferase
MLRERRVGAIRSYGEGVRAPAREVPRGEHNVMRTPSVALRRLAALAAGAALLGAAGAGSAQPPSAALRAAVADPARPAADRARDADRKPAEVLAFARVRPGEVVVDLIPGGGYFTRILAKAVEPGGRVYAVVPQMLAQVAPKAVDAAKAAAAGYPNVEARVEPTVVPPEGAGRVDLVWTAQNYHDLFNGPQGAATATAMNAAIFRALKPGGLYVIEDHAAAAGSGARDTKTLHRIDPALVRAEVEQAGFRFDGETRILANPADDHTKRVFDPALRGHTDQFVMRFRKP